MKQSILTIAFLLMSINSYSITQTCKGISFQGHEDSIIINSKKSHLTVHHRCFQTGDTWLDCDTDRGTYEKQEDELIMGAWKAQLNPDHTAQLYYQNELWAVLECF